MRRTTTSTARMRSRNRRARGWGNRSIAFAASAIALAAFPTSAASSVTLGQLQDPPASTCAAGTGPGLEVAQPTPPYVVPSTGGVTEWTISSWSATRLGEAGSAKLKVYRALGPATFRVVGQDIRRPLAAGLNTFSGIRIAAKAGDFIGANWTGTVPCLSLVAGGTSWGRVGDLADGASDTFEPAPDTRANIRAVAAPTNTFSLGPTSRNKRKGTAKITAEVPNPGELVISGKGLKRRSESAAAAGAYVLTVKAKGKKLRRLNDAGKAKVRPEITFTPTGGSSSSQPLTVKLRDRG